MLCVSLVLFLNSLKYFIVWMYQHLSIDQEGHLGCLKHKWNWNIHGKCMEYQMSAGPQSYAQQQNMELMNFLHNRQLHKG